MSTFPDSPGIPSTQFGGYIEEPPKWPKVIGIISIVWASLGLFCNFCGLLQGAMQGAFQGMAAGDPQMQQQMAMQVPPSPAMYVMYVLGIALGVLLLVAGIMLLKRNPKARVLHLGWAALAIILGIIGTYVQYEHMQATLAAMEQQAQQATDPKQAQAIQQMMPVMRASTMVGLVIGVVIAFAWPVFCLIWFGAIKKRPEDMGPAPADVL